MGFGTEIKRLRLEAGLTLRALAARAQVDYTYLSKIENEKAAPPSRAAIERLAQALDVTPKDLLAVADRDRSLGPLEVLGLLAQRAGAMGREQWQEIDRIAKAGLDEHYHLLNLVRGIGDEIATDDPEILRRQRKRVLRAWTWGGGTLKGKLWNLFYLLLGVNVRYRVDNAGVVSRCLRAGKRIVFVANHRDVTSLVTYLVKHKPIPGLTRLIVMASDSEDGRAALQFLKKARVAIQVVLRPGLGSPEKNRRRAALKDFARRIREVGVGATVMDERAVDGDGRRVSRGGPVWLAAATGAVILPVVARNRLECVLENSWDKHRIPLYLGKIVIGEPFEVKKGRGRDWRDSETRRLEDALAELDAVAGRSIKAMPFRL